jgi:hypothetical protein
MSNRYLDHYLKQGGSGAVFRGDPSLQGSGFSVFKGDPDLSGRGFTVFRGNRQSGAGIGSFFANIFRTIFPILAPIVSKAAGSFISNTATSLKEGKSFKDSAKGALKPAASTLLTATGEAISNHNGSGRKRRRTKSKSSMKHSANPYKRRKPKSKSRKKSDFIQTNLIPNF